MVHKEWLRYYTELPSRNADQSDNTLRYYKTLLGIDLAISQKDTADYTAMVAVHVFGFQESLKIYVDPIIINKRLTHKETLEEIEKTVKHLGGKHKVHVIVEDVGYQAAVIQYLDNNNYRVAGFKVHGMDKRARFVAVSHLFESRKVWLPQSTSKALAAQLVGFGIEKHDDLVDALVMTLQCILAGDRPVGNQRAQVGMSYQEMFELQGWGENLDMNW
ncbi:hypothetical protein TM7_0319 [candidate division TM7 genomosp. GTL1]|nr:hypothetical protein TM7_0319 [candidate division TM7 genomosp. GTL1]